MAHKGIYGIKNLMQRVMLVSLCALMILSPLTSLADATEPRWEAASDQIDQYLDAAFEAYLEGDSSKAYSNVNDAYFKIYEVTGFERQTLSYVSGPRKNAVELQFSTCKAAVKKTNEDEATKIEVRTALNKLKSMIREDGNKLSIKDGEVPHEVTHYLKGELVDYDPYADLAGDPNAPVHYDNAVAMAAAINELLDTAYHGYRGMDFQTAIDNARNAYYNVYAESGYALRVYNDLSLEDRQELDTRFQELFTLINNGSEKFQRNAVQREIRELSNIIVAKAERIDDIDAQAKAVAAEEALALAKEEQAKAGSPKWLTFIAAFGIIVREGLEAILIIAAIIAYLTKSGNARNLKSVYIGSLVGIVASFIVAAILAWAKSMWAGAGQSMEIIEGATALTAVCVLFYVSNWMISKSEAEAWSNYLDDKVQSSIARGSAMAMAFTAFLSVFREGAEVVLFYQPMLSEGNANMVWAGFGVGCILLVFVYLAIAKLSIKLPIKIFFTATSILMAIMCVSFLGAGIKELAEGGLFDVTCYVIGVPENSVIQIFGVFPYLETLVPQLILAIILIVTFMMAHYRNKLSLKDAEIARIKANNTGKVEKVAKTSKA